MKMIKSSGKPSFIVIIQLIIIIAFFGLLIGFITGCSDTNASDVNGLAVIWLGESSSAPVTCSADHINNAYYNSADGISYICNGSTWDILAKNGIDETVYVVNQTTSGTVLKNEEWSGNFTVTGDIVIPADKTLLIKEGANIIIDGHYSITNNGSLYIMGTQDSIVSIHSTVQSAGSWGGILNNGSNRLYIMYAHIQYADIGVFTDSVFNAYIEQLKVENCNIGGKFCATDAKIFWSSFNSNVNNGCETWWCEGDISFHGVQFNENGHYGMEVFNTPYLQSSPFVGYSEFISNTGYAIFHSGRLRRCYVADNNSEDSVDYLPNTGTFNFDNEVNTNQMIVDIVNQMQTESTYNPGCDF